MDNAVVVPFDLQRMIFGDQPLLFGVEIVVRTVIIYGYALVLLRWLGSRTIGQLSSVELLLVIALGSAVGDAMFYPEVPLLHSLLVVTIVVFANKGIDILIARSRKAERMIDGTAEEIIVDGVLREDFLRSHVMGINEAFQQLRHQGIEHLGQVRFAFVEPSGEVTLFRKERDVPPGLPIVPPWELHTPKQIGAAEKLTRKQALACLRCGTVRVVEAQADPGACPHCGNDKWTPAAGGLKDDARKSELVGRRPAPREPAAGEGTSGLFPPGPRRSVTTDYKRRSVVPIAARHCRKNAAVKPPRLILLRRLGPVSTISRAASRA